MTDRLVAAAAIVTLLAVAGCTGKTTETTVDGTPSSSPSPTVTTPPAAAFDLGSVRIRLDRVATGFTKPLFVTHAGDGSGRLFVVEQDGRIVVLDRSGRSLGAFLNLAARVESGANEQGLLGLAFHPDYESNARFFVYYTNNDGDQQVSEFRRRSATRADPGSERVILRMDDRFSNHNGGWLGFGPDGFLYISTGDGGAGGDPLGSGQRLSTLLGKILRIDVDGGTRYRVPRDNPFVGRSGARGEIWAYGLRNPWRLSFDRATGDVFIGDVGQGSREEVDVIPASTDGGQNFGWNVMEGTRCYAASSCRRTGLVLPVTDYATSSGCAVTGGYVYRGTAHPSLVGGYFYGDYCNGRIFALDARRAVRGPADERRVLDSGLQITSFGEDEAGEVYVVDQGGDVYRIRAA